MSTPFDFFPYKGSTLTVDGVPLEKVAQKTGTPVYVYSAEAFLTPLRKLQKGLAGIDHLVCFAVKSNSNVAVLSLLAKSGAGMDLVSGGELYRAGVAGVPGDRVVLSGVGKTPGEMAAGLKYGDDGIFSFNVESVAELQTLNAVALKMKRQAQVALRFNPDVDAKTHPYISTGLKKNKFGINRDEVLEIARNIGSFPGIRLRGVSIHIGSQLLSLSPLADAFKRARDLIAQLDTILPEPISYVDLGGGVGITYKDEKSPPVEKYCALVQKNFSPAARKRDGKAPLRVLIEPGRLLSGNSGVLVTEVLYRKERSQKDFLIVDAAMNDLLRPSLYGSFHGIVPVKKTAGTTKRTDIVGPVCETGDCFASDRLLPRKLKQGDLLAILSAGAYGFVMSGNYNSRPRPPEVLVHKGKIQVIRERESYDDLVRGENLL